MEEPVFRRWGAVRRPMAEDCYFAVDIGGSKLVAGLVAPDGRVIARSRFDYACPVGAELLLDKVCEGYRALTRGCPSARPVAAGVSVPGLTDGREGVWVYSPFSGIRDVPVARLLRAEIGLKVRIQNDVNACALAEKAFGACREVDDYLWVTVSNGIGGALVLGGRLYEGAVGHAGEIGHFLVSPGGARCGCGRRGCLEAEAAGPAISRMYREWTGKALSAKQIAQAAGEGDGPARRAFFESGRHIGRALAEAANLLNPACAVLGGGVALSFDLLEGGLRESLAEGLFEAANPNFRVIPTGLGYDASLLGAAVLAMEGEQ